MRASRLAGLESPYLARGAEQPVDWWPWCADAFAVGKPLLLVLGTSSSHACHALDVETFDESEVARALAGYTAVRVDADERPDVDVRYQALAGQPMPAWPLVCRLSPTGELQAARAHLTRTTFREFLAAPVNVNVNVNLNVNLSVDEAVAEGLSRLRASYTPAFGGFGPPPRPPHAPALDLLLELDEPWAHAMAMRTLLAMSAGGLHDQLGGGFHRYSTDDKWIVPHFEKRAADQAALLSTYVRAFVRFGEPRCAEVARGIVGYVLERLGPAAAEDSDVGAYDDGSHYTFTVEEAAAALAPDELACAVRHWDIFGRGELHTDPTRNVLFVAQPVVEIARDLRRPTAEVQALLESARAKLLSARCRRPRPALDESVYVGSSAHLCRALLEADRALSLPPARAYALALLARLQREAIIVDGVRHRLGGDDELRWLEDHAQLGLALLAGGEPGQAASARALGEQLVARFSDPAGGFFDRPRGAGGPGELGRPFSLIEDGPAPSGNALAGALLLALGQTAPVSSLCAALLPRAAALGARGAGLIRLALAVKKLHLTIT